MTNEAVILALNPDDNAVRRTCQSTVAITKGALLKLIDPNTISGANIGSGDAFGGIAAADKTATDEATDIGCHMTGVFDLTNAGGTITTGAAVVMSGANLIRTAVEADMITGALVGYAEETAAANEVIRVRLRGI